MAQLDPAEVRKALVDITCALDALAFHDAVARARYMLDQAKRMCDDPQPWGPLKAEVDDEWQRRNTKGKKHG